MKKRIISFLAVLLILVTVFPVSVFAEESSSDVELITDLSKTTIEYDFENVFCGTFKVEDYRPNSTKSQRQIVALTEHVNSNGEIELYFYLYNPKQAPILNTGENKVTLSCSTGTVKFEEYQKYDIKQIDARYFSTNVASKTNASLIKYKVEGFALSTEETLRAYSISELELRLTNGVLVQTIGKSYTFVENVDGTLDVTTDGQEVIEIDKIGHTYYRVQTDTYGKYNDIRTVYFAVEKDVVDKNGMMDSVNVVWEEKDLKPVLLLDDMKVANAFQDVLGKEDLSDFKYSFGAGIRPGALSVNTLAVGHVDTTFKYGFNTDKNPGRFYAGTESYFDGLLDGYVKDFLWSEHYHNVKSSGAYDEIIDKLYFAMYCDYDNFSVVESDVFLNTVDKYDGKNDGLYADELFTSSTYHNVTYSIGDTYELNKYKVDTSYLSYLLHWHKYSTKKAGDVEFARFERFATSDLDKYLIDSTDFGKEQNRQYLANKYQIAPTDVDDFKAFVNANKDCYIYFIRYSVTDTYLDEASVFGNEYLSTGSDLVDSYVPLAECYACNGTLARTVFVNDFDIITLGFNDATGNYSVVPVSSTPTDSLPGLEQIEKKLPPEHKASFVEKLFDVLKDLALIMIVVSTIVVVTIAVLIVVIIIKILTRKRGKNSEKKNN